MMSKITLMLMIVCYSSAAALNVGNSAFLASVNSTTTDTKPASNTTDTKPASNTTAATTTPKLLVPTCQEASMTASDIKASLNFDKCNDAKNGVYTPAVVDMNSFIGNNDGKFVLGGKDFSKTCTNLELVGTTLSGTCTNKAGSTSHTSLDMAYHFINNGSDVKYSADEVCHSFTLDGTNVSATCKGAKTTTPADLAKCMSLNGNVIGMQSGQSSFTGKDCTLSTEGILNCGALPTQQINILPYLGNGTELTCSVSDITTAPSVQNNQCYDMKLDGANLVANCANGMGKLLPQSKPWNGTVKVGSLGNMTVSTKSKK